MRYLCMGAAVLMLTILSGCGGPAVDTGQRFDPSNASDEQKLIFSVRDGDTATLGKYLAKYPELATMRDTTGNTLLHHAAMAGQMSTAQTLLEAGADVNALNWDNLTPAGAAEDRTADPAIIRYLKEQGGSL